MSNALQTPFKLTPKEEREYAERIETIKTMLARSPYLTKSHFSDHYGYRHAFLCALEKEHGVKFGGGEKHRVRLEMERKAAA